MFVFLFDTKENIDESSRLANGNYTWVLGWWAQVARAIPVLKSFWETILRFCVRGTDHGSSFKLQASSYEVRGSSFEVRENHEIYEFRLCSGRDELWPHILSVLADSNGVLVDTTRCYLCVLGSPMANKDRRLDGAMGKQQAENEKRRKTQNKSRIGSARKKFASFWTLVGFKFSWKTFTRYFIRSLVWLGLRALVNFFHLFFRLAEQQQFSNRSSIVGSNSGQSSRRCRRQQVGFNMRFAWLWPEN